MGRTGASYEKTALPNLEKISKMAERGATHKSIADALGIHPCTFSEWVNKHPELRGAVDAATLIANDNVVSALYRRALGYKYDEVTKKPLVDVIAKKLVKEYNERIAKGDETKKITLEQFRHAFENETVVTQTTTKEVPPETTAAIIWLTNKDRENWKHRHETTIRNVDEAANLLDRREKLAKEQAKLKEQGKREGKVVDLPGQRAQGE